MAAATVDDTILDCPICLETFEKPRTLVCQHSFCETCLQGYIDLNARDRRFQCPVCRQEIRKPGNGDVALTAASFPINPIIVSLLDNQKERPCDCCSRVDENEDGEFWCEKCEDVLCGKCKEVHKKTKFTYTHDIETLEERKLRRRQRQPRTVGDHMTASAVFVTAVNKRDVGRGNFEYTGGTFLSDDRLLFANNAYGKGNHGSLELYDQQYKFVKLLSIWGRPSTLAVNYTDGTIFVVVNMNTILVCDLKGEDLGIVKQVSVDIGTWGIAISPLGNAVTATEDEIKYRTSDRNVCTLILKSGEFKDSYVALSKDGESVYYIDDDSKLKGVKLDGTRVLDYSSGRLDVPVSMCVDCQDNIYVCGRSSHNIHQISSDGQQKRILCNLPEIRKPDCMFFHPTKNLFVVTSDENDNIFAVYKLQ